MVVTYRLAGVDGEATEDKVDDGDLVDPEAPPKETEGGLAAYEEKVERQFGITRLVAEGRGVSVLLKSVELYLSEVLRRIRRDDLSFLNVRRSCPSGVAASTMTVVLKKNPSRAKFNKSSAHPGLILFQHCANLAVNRRRMVKARAPTLLLRMLLDVLNAIDESSARSFGRGGHLLSDQSASKGSVSSEGRPSGFGGNVDGLSENPTVDGELVGDSSEVASGDRGPTSQSVAGNNPTATALQGLIEVLASDISAGADKAAKKSPLSIKNGRVEDEVVTSMVESDNEDESTLPLLLSSLRTTSLSPPLRRIIAKLLPFLTYGQAVQSRELASNFMRYVYVDRLVDGENGTTGSVFPFSEQMENDVVLMETFVQAAINLPSVAVCDALRTELILQGFVARVRDFVLQGTPVCPPPWSPALFGKIYGNTKDEEEAQKNHFEKEWAKYFGRKGLRTALRILIGLSAGHAQTQQLLADINTPRNERSYELKSSAPVTAPRGGTSLLEALHWIESTCDKVSSKISLDGLGLLSETLLDGLQDNNDLVKEKIRSLRQTTRDRKREIAEERRNRALVGLSSFGPLAGAATELSTKSLQRRVGSTVGTSETAVVPAVAVNRSDASSALGSALSAMIGLTGIATALGAASRQQEEAPPPSRATATGANAISTNDVSKPAWLLEMEAMEDEKGLTCAVCQEGRTLQPSELLGLYAHVKKVSIPYNKCGGRGNVDGTVLLLSLPRTLPPSLRGTDADNDWFRPARAAVDAMQTTPHAASAMAAATATSSGSTSGSRPSHFVTTVTAGNAIHCNCHARARTADRNHPKAPKSEWEGASLRNSRVTCNVILPLVSSKSSKVPLMAVESALADHQTVVSNTLGSRPKSMLWNTMHDIRLLLLRMAYGESLNADCGGGSLTSNASMVFRMLFLADMFANDAEHDVPETAQHARGLNAGFLAAFEILKARDYLGRGGVGGVASATTLRLRRGLADAAPMACLTCVLFFNLKDDASHGHGEAKAVSAIAALDEEAVSTSPHPKRRWMLHRDRFLRGLLQCAGRRHACNVDGSGCATDRRSASSSAARRMRSSSLTDWEDPDILRGSGKGTCGSPGLSIGSKRGSLLGKRSTPGITEYAAALRPAVTLYAIFDAISADFTLDMDDAQIEAAASRLVDVIKGCQKAGNIQELLHRAGVSMDHDAIMEEFLKGKEESSVV